MTHEHEPRVTVVEREDSMHGLVIGRLVEVDSLGAPRVECEGLILEARTTIALGSRDVGRTLVIAFERGNQSFPIVIGALHEPLEILAARPNTSVSEAEIDGERVVLSAKREIVLECGQASLTLKRDGRVIIQGTHVLSRSSGPNRIKGATINLN